MYYPPLPPRTLARCPRHRCPVYPPSILRLSSVYAPSMPRLTFAVKTALGGHLGLFGPLLGPHLAHLSTFCDQLGSLRTIFASKFAKNRPKGLPKDLLDPENVWFPLRKTYIRSNSAFFDQTRPKVLQEGPPELHFAPLGSLLGSFWPQLGPNWAPLGPKLAHPSALWPPQVGSKAPPESPQKARKLARRPPRSPKLPRGPYFARFWTLWDPILWAFGCFLMLLGALDLEADLWQKTQQTHLQGPPPAYSFFFFFEGHRAVVAVAT